MYKFYLRVFYYYMEDLFGEYLYLKVEEKEFM